MVDIITITGTLSAAIATLKEIAKVAEKTKDKELNQRVLELQQFLMTANTQLLELSTENQGLRQRISELERKADIEAQLTSDGEVYWWNRDGKKDGPYCKVCWRSEGHLIQLMAGGQALFDCVRCKGAFRSSSGQGASHNSFSELFGSSAEGQDDQVQLD
jgi:hypothetical protein